MTSLAGARAGRPDRLGAGRRPRWRGRPAAESNRLLYWSLVVLGVMFLMSLGRWVFQLSRLLSGPRSTIIPASHPAEDIPPGELDAWVDSVANTEEEEPDRDAT